jgi:hypothetical protein
LDNGAAVGVPVCLAEFIRCGIWELLEQDGLDIGIPRRVDDGFMREHRVSRTAGRPGKDNGKSANRCKTSSPDGMYLGLQNSYSSLP